MNNLLSIPSCRPLSLVFLVTCTALFVCSAIELCAHEGHAVLPSKGATVDGDQLLLSESASKAIGLTLGKVSLEDLHQYVRAYANVKLPWRQHALVSTLVPGRIEKVLVTPGDTVRVGQELTKLTSFQLESLQLDLLQAATEVDLAQRFVKRRDPLATQGIIAGENIFEDRSSLEQKTMRHAIARLKLLALGLSNKKLAQLTQAEIALGDLSISSPIDGIVTDVDVQLGRVVKSTEHLFHIVDLSKLWVIGNVLETDISKVHVGQTAEVTFASLPDKQFLGKIEHVHYKVDSKLRTRDVVLTIDNTQNLLRPGMFGRAAVRTASSEQAITCPSEAIIETISGSYVLLRKGEGKFLRRPIQIGMVTHDRVEISKGLFPGDQVITTGNHILNSLFAGEGKGTTSHSLVNAKSENSSTNSISGITTDASTNPHLLVLQAKVELPTDSYSLATSQLEGRVAEILVEHSEKVKPRQTLIEIDSLELRNLQGKILAEKSQQQWALQAVRRLEKLNQQNLAIQRQLWKRQTELKLHQVNLDSFSRQLALLGVGSEKIQEIKSVDLLQPESNSKLIYTLPVRSSTNGRIVEMNVVLGQVVQKGDILLEIHDLSRMWIKGFVFQQDYSRLQIGQTARISFPAYPGMTVKGQVIRKAPEVSKNQRVFPVWIEIDNPDEKILSGMIARVEIETKSPPLLLSSQELFRSGAQLSDIVR